MSIEKLYADIQNIIETARNKVCTIANPSIVQSYWNIGKLLVEEEQFYQSFENLHALRGELSWTHYRLLLKVENKTARA